MSAVGTWRMSGCSCTGVGYGYHVVRRHMGEGVTEWGVLLCLGTGPVLGRGAVERLQPVAGWDEAHAVGDAFNRACLRWRRTVEEFGAEV